MKARRILVSGARGQLGHDLVDVLGAVSPPGADSTFRSSQPVMTDEFEVLALSHAELDVTDPDQVKRVTQMTQPDVIVHLAAYTAVDLAEREVEKCFAINDHAVETMSRAAGEVGAHFVTISTDYVFSGAKGSPYVEEDQTGPLNVYGASKRDGELRCSPEDSIIRTSWVMGVRGKSVLHVICERALKGEYVRFVDDQVGTLTAAPDLAAALVAVIREQPGGVWHVANSGATSWFDVAAHCGRVLGREDDFATRISTGELSPAPLATRPARSDLSSQKFASAFGELPPWRDALSRLATARAEVVS